MHVLALALSIALQTEPVQRDAYGVARITVETEQEAFYWYGRTIAEDRLWQIEMSRRLSRGRMAEVMGKSALASDTSLAQTGYTDEELQRQLDGMPDRVKQAFDNYSRGINDTIAARKEGGTLPPGFTQFGYEPEQWTPLDSAAIAINLVRQFGRGGAGELRNYALYLYLKTQACGDQVFDVIDDLAWQNDPSSIPTVSIADDPLKGNPPRFPEIRRAQTEAHVKALPLTNIFELLPAIQLTTGEETDLIAKTVGAPWKVGSYAVVVSAEKSKTGYPMLLSAPQMGHSTTSVVHEIAIDCPTLKVAGFAVPGVPAVIVGYTPEMAWGLTSGVADVEDIFYAPMIDDDTYQYGAEERKLTKLHRRIKVKGEDDVTIEVTRTHHGPVVLQSKVGKAVYSVQSSFWHKELNGIVAIFDLYNSSNSRDIQKFIAKIPVTFNFFFATTAGETGYWYAGLVPFRAPGYDPRFPTPSQPDTAWQGFVSSANMPHVINPGAGFLANWNNKPASWWPNFDTPVWGSPFRNEVLLNALPEGKIGRFDLEKAAWEIARRETTTSGVFIKDFKTVLDAETSLGTKTNLSRYLASYEGWEVDGSAGAMIYSEAIKQLRDQIFKPHTGNFLQPALFETIIQPHVIRKALHGETTYDFLAGREPFAILKSAMNAAYDKVAETHGPNPATWSYTPGSISVTGQARIPYINRGTYIQIIELSPTPFGRNVASPGVSEAGKHSTDQADLARAWTFKPMWGFSPR